MPRLLRPTLAILPVSLLGPGLWLLVQCTRLSNSYAGGVLEPALLYGVLPALTLWLGSLPVALATWLLWRRISAWAVPAFAAAVIPSLGLVLYAAEGILPTRTRGGAPHLVRDSRGPGNALPAGVDSLGNPSPAGRLT